MHETCRLVVDVEADPRAEPASEDLRILLFEATRELLFNVVKHARTSSARVTLSAAPGGGLEIVVSDEGAGFNPAEPKLDRAMATGFGLFSIRERLELLGGRMQSTPRSAGERELPFQCPLQQDNSHECGKHDHKAARKTPHPAG